MGEIADLFERQILEAKRLIYAESQYFASRRIAEALCKRLSQPDPPEVLIVHPANADGWLEQQAMDHARAELVRTLGEADPHNRFNLYVPYTDDTPIYAHAKIMIVDDRIIRVGSANMNNRSMGLDSECDLFIDAARPGNAHAAPAIARLGHTLRAEHWGLQPDEAPGLREQAGSMRAMIESIDHGIGLIDAKLEELGLAENTLVIFLSDNGGCAEFLDEDPLPNQNSISDVIEDVVDAKSILLRAYQPNTRGVILFMSGLERECITLLGRLARRSPQPYVLAIGTEQHHELLPTLLESGADTVLFDVQNDIPVAEWCCRILRAAATYSLPTL